MNSIAPNREDKAVRSEKTALVVDHVKEMLDLLEIALRCAEFSVLRASSVPEALKLFEERAEDIDLLMTEVRVGPDSGLDLARRLVAVKPSMRVLAISEVARDQRLVTAQQGVAFLSKPFSASELKRELKSVFRPESDR
jgi:DNA-binding NtrC family response regulator